MKRLPTRSEALALLITCEGNQGRKFGRMMEHGCAARWRVANGKQDGPSDVQQSACKGCPHGEQRAAKFKGPTLIDAEPLPPASKRTARKPVKMPVPGFVRDAMERAPERADQPPPPAPAGPKRIAPAQLGGPPKERHCKLSECGKDISHKHPLASYCDIKCSQRAAYLRSRGGPPAHPIPPAPPAVDVDARSAALEEEPEQSTPEGSDDAMRDEDDEEESAAELDAPAVAEDVANAVAEDESDAGGWEPLKRSFSIMITETERAAIESAVDESGCRSLSDWGRLIILGSLGLKAERTRASMESVDVITDKLCRMFSIMVTEVERAAIDDAFAASGCRTMTEWGRPLFLRALDEHGYAKPPPVGDGGRTPKFAHPGGMYVAGPRPGAPRAAASQPLVIELRADVDVVLRLPNPGKLTIEVLPERG